jgi:hypothetical protein
MQLYIFAETLFTNRKYNFTLLRFFNPFPYHDEKEGNADMPLEKFISYLYGVWGD